MVPPFSLPQKVMNFYFLFFPSSKVMTFLVIVTTRTLSTFPGDRLSSVLVKSAAKNTSTFVRVSPPRWCHLEQFPHALPSDATAETIC